MRLYPIILISASCALALLTSGCANNDVLITEGKHDQGDSAPVIQENAPLIVHVDLFERIATIRNGVALGGDFLIAKNYAGVETGVLKVRPSSSLTLITADILEGSPKINHVVESASANRSVELAQLYSIASEEN